MHRSGAQLVRYALEQLNTEQTFGVVGDPNREIYNELQNSSIHTHLVNQEISAAFMVDAISRTAQGEAVGTMLITADAIINQGIAEAFITGVPLLIIAGAAHSQPESQALDQQQLLKPLTKARFKISRLQDIVSSLFEAHQIATSGKPGPVYLEIPMALQLQSEELDEPLPLHLCAANQPELDMQPQAIPALLYQLQQLQGNGKLFEARAKTLGKTIAKYRAQQRQDWLEHNSKGRVNPAVFFAALNAALDNQPQNKQAIIVTGHGTHRALAAELLAINNPQGFICPSSFNAMGYCVPAVNAIKLANPSKQVVGIVGDGAMMINGMEIQTAVRQKLGTLYCLFNNSQRNSNKNPGHMNWGAFADALECGYFPITNNQGIDTILRRALETTAQGQPVILEVSVDYSRKSYYAMHQDRLQQARLPGKDRLGEVKRAIVRRFTNQKG